MCKDNVLFNFPIASFSMTEAFESYAEFIFAKIRPKYICVIKFSVGALPQHIVAQPLFSAGSDKKIRIRNSVCT